jgi:hypothetical protein
MNQSEDAHPMIPQTAQVIATEQPTRTTGRRFSAVLANACECLGSAKVVIWLLELSSCICGVKQNHASKKVASYVGNW